MSDKGQRARATDTVVEADLPDRSALLEDLLTAPVTRRAAPATDCLVATCVEDRHPVLQGRIKIAWTDDDPEQQLWVPTLHGLAVRPGDRVLLVRPGNSDEWIVTGVVDGFARRPPLAPVPAARLELKPDEALQVVSEAGQTLVEVSQGAGGPLVRLLQPDVQLQFAGKLVLRAEDLELEATRGQVAIKASDDVVVRGEIVRLN